MKKVILLILLCAVMLTLKATGQSGDVIRLEGEEWVLMAKPIGYDSLLCRRMGDFLPENVQNTRRPPRPPPYAHSNDPYESRQNTQTRPADILALQNGLTA